MKRILLVSMYAIACITMISCTNETAIAKDSQATVVASDPNTTKPPIKP